MRLRSLGLILALAGASLAVVAADQDRASSPAYAVPPNLELKRVEGRQGVVTSANGLASEAGIGILRAGGNAVDAAVATAFAIGVVEPQMSGLGGSGAALVWTKAEATPTYLDFYAAQPADSWRGHTFPQAGEEGAGRIEPGDLRIVGIPGNVAGLLALHERFGRLPRERVMAEAIRLAEEGFPVGQVLADFIADGAEKMKPFPGARALYFPNDRPLAPGAVLRNPALAESLRRVARDGRRGFYEGPLAETVVATLHAGGHPATLADLTGFEPQWKRPLCTDYRGRTVLSAPPPQTGLQVLNTLEQLEPFDLGKLGLPTRSAAAFDVLTSALRAGQATARGNGDPNWVEVPANGLASADFAATRRSLVGAGAAAAAIEPADARPFDGAAPPGECARYDPYGPAPAMPATGPGEPRGLPGAEPLEEPSGETTHMSVVDKDGNAVSLTQTNSSVWGSGGFTSGFFLNDSGFRFTEANVGVPSLSRWRIRTTTISPTIVVRGGQVQMAVGAPGGGRIPTEIAQVMVYVLDYDMDPLDAVLMPRIFTSPRDPRVQLEHGFSPALLRDIRAMGYDPVPPSPGYARLYLIVRRGDTWIGVADPRHDGEPRGY